MVMSSFYPLKLIGTGTRQVECCASYFTRLAEQHGFTCTELHRAMKFHDQKDKKLWKGSVPQSNLGDIAFINRISMGSQKIHALIEKHAKENNINRSCIFIPIPRLARYGHEIASKDLRWCPLCLKEDTDKKSQPYLRLIWQIKEITACEKHWVKLMSRCPHCHMDQRQSTIPWRDMSKCRHCHQPLTETWNHCSEMDIGAFFWGYCDIVEMISKGESYSWETIKKNIAIAASLKNKTIEKLTSEADKFYSMKNSLSGFFTNDKFEATLYQIFIFCHLCDISIWEALNGTFNQSQLPLNLPAWEPYLAKSGFCNNRKKHTSPKKYTQSLIQERSRNLVADIINKSIPPLTLKQISSESNISLPYIRKHWPGLIDLAKRKRSEHLENTKYAERIESEILCRETIAYFTRSAAPVTPTSVARTISESTTLPFNLLYATAKKILSEYKNS